MSSYTSASLVVRNLTLARGARTLFVDLSFETRGGELALVTGANGAGKTTLLRALAGLTVPTTGSIALDGQSTSTLARSGDSRIAFQGHADGLKRDLSVVENLRFYASLWRCAEPPTTHAEALDLVDCLERPVRYLSAGQRRRAALGCLRMRPAPVWLLDEPLTNLDDRGTALIRGWVGEHLARGGTAVIATHRPDELATLAATAVEL